jgi:hypothetical protein
VDQSKKMKGTGSGSMAFPPFQKIGVPDFFAHRFELKARIKIILILDQAMRFCPV